MIDRTELELRLAAHARLIDGRGQRQPATRPLLAPRVALADLLLRLAARLDPAAARAATGRPLPGPSAT